MPARNRFEALAAHDALIVAVAGQPGQVGEYVLSSPMLVTALNPHIGYDNAAMVAKEAIKTGKTLREVCVSMGLLSGQDFDRLVKPEEMTRPA